MNIISFTKILMGYFQSENIHKKIKKTAFKIIDS